MKAYGDIRFRKCTVFLLTLAQTACLAFSQDLQIHVSLSQDQVFVGDPVILSVTVSGAGTISDPEIPVVEGLEISPPQRRSERSVSIVNFTKTEQVSSAFQYQITPRRTGTFTLGPIRARVKNQIVSHPAVTFRAQGGEIQDVVILELKSTSDSVLVDEPFEVTMSILLKRIGGQYANHDPIHPQSPPLVVLPALDNTPDGLVAPDIKAILQGALINNSREPGFRLNNFTVRNDPFSMFSLGSLSQARDGTFNLKRSEVRRGNVNYFEYSLALKYSAEREGRYTFEAPTFKGQVITAVDPGGRINTRPIMTTGGTLVVNVTPPPTEGRPDSFIGCIGTGMVAEASLNMQTCKVGDPLTLTIDIGGNISLNNMEPPDLSRQDAFVRRFRVVEDSVQTETHADRKTYRYTIRSKEAGTYELPSIEMSYYDTLKREYQIVKTAPIPFRAQKVAEVSDDWIVNQSTNRTSQSLISHSDWLIVAPMTASPEGAEPDSIIDPRRHAPMASAGFLLFLVANLANLARRVLQRFRFGGKHRTAGRYARRALQRIGPDDGAAEALADIRSVMGTFLQEKFRLPTLPQTPQDVEHLLRRSGRVSTEAADSFVAIYQQAFNHQFSRAADDLNVMKLRDSALAAISLVEPRKSRPTKSAHLLLIALSASCVRSATAGEVSLEHRFLWDEASAALAHARTPDEFRHAAELHRKMLQAGVVNGPVLYNMGTALLKAERYKDAIVAFNRAERYMGSSSDMKRNMAIAAAEGRQGGSQRLSWLRVPLFWHYELSGRMRTSIAACAFSVFWLAVLLQRVGAAFVGRPLLIFSALVFAVFGTSGVATWHAEKTSQQVDRVRSETWAPDPNLPGQPATRDREAGS